MKTKPISPIIFGYKSILKKEWRNGNLPSVKYGIYGGILTQNNVSIEHILPKSKNGKTKLNNVALATKEFNELRGNRPLRFFLDKDKFITYVEQFEKINIPTFNGKEYIKELIKTIIETLEMGK